MYPTDSTVVEFCPDTGAGLCLLRESDFTRAFPDISKHSLNRKLLVRGVGGRPLKALHYAEIPVRLRTVEDELLDFSATVFIVPHLPISCLMGNSFLQREGVNILWRSPMGFPTLDIHGKHVRLRLAAAKGTPARIRIRARESFIIPSGHGINAPVDMGDLPEQPNGYVTQSTDRFIDASIGQYTRLASGIIQGNESVLPMANLGRADIRVRKGQVLGTAEVNESMRPNDADAYVHLAMEDIFQGLPAPPDRDDDDPPAGMPFVVQPAEESTIDIAEAHVSDYWGADFKQKVLKVLQRHSILFRKELGRFKDNIKMPIPFRNDANLSRLKQAPYNLSARDKEAVNNVLDPLVKQGRVKKVPLGQPSAAASPAFVVWKNGKARVVVDLRRVNMALYPDAYPLPKQDTILSAMGGATIFSSLDMTKGFFQQDICEDDQWKTAFVTPHRGQEMLTVSTMGLANSPGFFQHRMEDLFAQYLWNFVLVYIDDIIVFSRALGEHLEQLNTVLGLLADSGITISLAKCHFAFPSLQALGHHVSRLGLSTVAEKTDAIQQMEFPRTLRQLEHILGFFGYYRKFVPYYAAVSEPLVRLKTIGFKDGPKQKGAERERHAERCKLETLANADQLREAERAFIQLKEKLCSAPTLMFPDFNREFILYVDGSREKGFGAALHQIDITDPDRPIERPVLFISKSLTAAEERYWPTELETAALVWTLQKLQQYTDGTRLVIHCDHQAIAQAFRSDGPIKGKRSDRLINWRLFLSRYIGKVEIKHRPGAEHRNADGLSRIHTVSYAANPTGTPVTRYGFPIEANFRSDLLQLTDQYKRKILRYLPKDPALRKIYRELDKISQPTADPERPPCTTRESFRIDTTSRLLFQMEAEGHERLCIPRECVRPLLEYAHDRQAHAGRHRTIARLRANLFIPNLRRIVMDYVAGCPTCQVSKSKRHKPYGKMQAINSPAEPFAVQCLDFIVELPTSRTGCNALLVVTDKFTKFVRLIPGKTTFDARDWAVRYFDYCFSQYGLPVAFISDRDPKFNSDFWRALFERAGVKLAMTTAYHPQADGQSERSIQTIEVALRSMLAGDQKALSEWDELIPDTEFAINTAESATTGYSPFFLLYGTHPRDGTTLTGEPTDRTAEQFREDRRLNRALASDHIRLAQAKMAQYYDERRSIPPRWKPGDEVYIKLVRGTRIGYKLPTATALDVIKMGPFPIEARISDLAYRVKLPPDLKIHPTISIAHLEPKHPDHYHRKKPPPPAAVVKDGEQAWDVDRILRKELRRHPGDSGRKWYYRVRWKGFSPRDDSWEPEDRLRQDVPDIVDQYEQIQAEKATRGKRQLIPAENPDGQQRRENINIPRLPEPTKSSSTSQPTPEPSPENPTHDLTTAQGVRRTTRRPKPSWKVRGT